MSISKYGANELGSPHPPQHGGDPRRFYTIQHTFDCGIDRHVDWMYVCVIDADGEVRVHKNLRTDPKAFRLAVKPFREDVLVCVECMFTWDLARRSLRGRGDSCRPGTCPLQAGDARRQRQERPHRLAPDRGAATRRTHSPGLRLPAEDARHARSSAPQPSSHAQVGRVVRAHPEYRQPA
jgi:hypothetical protein